MKHYIINITQEDVKNANRITTSGVLIISPVLISIQRQLDLPLGTQWKESKNLTKERQAWQRSYDFKLGRYRVTI